MSTDGHSGLLIEIVCHELALEPKSVVSLTPPESHDPGRCWMCDHRQRPEGIFWDKRSRQQREDRIHRMAIAHSGKVHR